MRRVATIIVFLIACAAAGDVRWRNGGSTLGTVVDVNCVRDGGLLCTRDAGSVGDVRCMEASSTETGCVTLGAQTWLGDKTVVGTVKATVLDGGVAAVGSMDLRANTFTGLSTSSSLTIQSNTSASTTTNTVAAMTFKLGANIGGDLGWRFEDSSGTKRFGVTGTGTVYARTMVTDDGAATATGESFSVLVGTGGASSGATPAGAGGTALYSSGAGGSSAGSAAAGNGGQLTILSGAGGSPSGAQPGGSGGNILILAGNNRAGASAAGNITVTAGPGAQATASLSPSAGGAVSISGGAGGATSSGTGEAGGAVTIRAGTGGNGVSGTSGVGGDLTLTSGNAGTAGVSGGASGNVTLDTGAATGAATNGTMSLGTTSANSITIGRSGKAVTVNGYGVLTTHGTTVLAVESGASAMTANELAVTFGTAFGAAPACTCTHVNTTNTNPCNIKSGSTPTTTTVTFAVASGGTDVVDWICIGTR